MTVHCILFLVGVPGASIVRPSSFRGRRGSSLKGSFRGTKGSFRNASRPPHHSSTGRGSFRGSFRAVKQSPPAVPVRAAMKPKIETKMVREREKSCQSLSLILCVGCKSNVPNIP